MQIKNKSPFKIGTTTEVLKLVLLYIKKIVLLIIASLKESSYARNKLIFL